RRVVARLLRWLAGRGRRRGSRHLRGRLRIADEDLGACRKPSVLLRQRYVNPGDEAAISPAAVVLADESLLQDHGVTPVGELDALVREPLDRLAEDDEALDPGTA